MEILDKKSNRMSRVIAGVSEANLLASFWNFLEVLRNSLLRASYDADSWFLSLGNLLNNELFFTFH